MHNMQDKSIDLSEAVLWNDAKIDSGNGVIRGVKLLGCVSKNGNHYPPTTLAKALNKFEGLAVNLNHPDKKNPLTDTPIQTRFGKVMNVQHVKDGVYGELHYLKSHQYTPVFLESAERMPDLIGMSINGKGTVTKNKKGETIVESIDSLRSVDLVADPATNKSLFESEDEATPESAVEEAFCQAVVAVCKGEGTTQEKVKRIKEILKAQEKLQGSDEEEEEPAEQMPAEESWKEEYESLKLEKDCRQLLESKGISAEQGLVEMLVHMDGDDAREKFVAWHKRKSVVRAPRSSDVGVVKEEKTDWAALLRSRN